MKKREVLFILVAIGAAVLVPVIESSDSSPTVWQQMKRFFKEVVPSPEEVGKSLNLPTEQDVRRDIEYARRQLRFRRDTRRIPLWKKFFLSFWKNFLSLNQPHFYRNWKPIPFVPIKPYRRTPPTTPQPEVNKANGTSGQVGGSPKPESAPPGGATSAPNPQPTAPPAR